MEGTTARLAAFIRTAAVPPAVRMKAKKSLADTLGVMLSGASSEVRPALERLVGEHGGGSCAILGTRWAAPAQIAALVNGTFGHALDFDDGIVSAPVHPSSVVVAALLTMPGLLRGTTILDAYTVGVEVAVKLATAIGIDHYHHGWHGTGTIGLFGAIAALAHARGLDPGVTQVAFGIGASMSSGIQRNFGTMTKPLHSGWAAHNAVLATELARGGLSAAADALEGDNGFFRVYGNERSSFEALARLGTPYAIDDPGLSLKRYACCYASHRPMEGLLALRAELGLTAANARSVACYLAPGSMRALIYPRPSTGLEGKFSLEYALAAGVLDGRYTLWTFGDEAVRRPEIAALLPRVKASEDARCAVGDPHAATRGPSRRGFVEIHAETTDGRKSMRRVDRIPGSPDWELTWEELRAKFLDCAASAGIEEGRAGRAFERLGALEQESDFSAISALLRP